MMDIRMPYKAVLTREQFLFFEMKVTANLMIQGNSDEDIINQIVDENLFQYPTERMIKNLAKVCVARLRKLDNNQLVEIVANGSLESAKQVCLYSMMLYYRIVWEFMTGVIGEKYKNKDFSYSKKDMNVFFASLQEQNDDVACWTELTVSKIKQVLNKILLENQYIDSLKSDKLNPILIDVDLKSVLEENGDRQSLAAFNCFDRR